MVPGLQREDVQAVYQRLLGRDARPTEIDGQLAALQTIEQLLDVVLASQEYGLREATAATRVSPMVVNSYHPDLERWTLPPGTRSPDGVAIVGHQGWLFLAGGTNAIVDQFTGAAQMQSTWLDGWVRLVEQRRAAVARLGARMAILVVPDKLAVHGEHYPEALHRATLRPIERLIEEAGLPIAYPVGELRAATATGSVSRRTDTHFTFAGNACMHRCLCALLDVPSALELGDVRWAEYLTSGDLGSRFDPPVLEPVRVPQGYGRTRVLEDNRAEIAAVGGHIGTRRVFVSEQAPDPRTLVMFGDSYGFSSDSYQGISWFLAQHFRQVHFVWVPMGWDPRYAEEVGAELVVFQTAERFVSRLPRDEVDVRALAVETIRRRQAIGIEGAFS